MARIVGIGVKLLWASPWTLLGLAAGIIAIATGGTGRRVGRVLEFHGGWLPWFLRCVPIAGGASAMTLDHGWLAQQWPGTTESGVFRG
jgi:hypothetical protein